MSQPEETQKPVVTIGGQEVALESAGEPVATPPAGAPGEVPVDLEPVIEPTYVPNEITGARNWTPLTVTIALLSLIGLVTVLVLVWRLRARVLRRGVRASSS